MVLVNQQCLMRYRLLCLVNLTEILINPQLVNSINKKNCVVELRFSIAKSKFHIIRGIKPNIFQIFKNGNIINESSHSKDYQKILEKNIIKMNHKSFHQIVVLGSTSFTPFMELPAAHRREVIEDAYSILMFFLK